MANFIQTLQTNQKAHQENLRDLEREINYFLIHLHSDKFRGTDNGERKDWIATGDVILRMQEMRKIVLAGLSI
jgi:hypothetical protein